MNSFPAQVGIDRKISYMVGLIGVILASEFIEGRNPLLESRESYGKGRKGSNSILDRRHF